MEERKKIGTIKDLLAKSFKSKTQGNFINDDGSGEIRKHNTICIWLQVNLH